MTDRDANFMERPTHRLDCDMTAHAARSASRVLAWLLVTAVAGQASPFAVPASASSPDDKDDGDRSRSGSLRQDALSRARVWQDPGRTLAQADLGSNPSDAGVLAPANPATCRFQPRQSGGATPKFACEFDDGEVLKVKYGSNEVHTETAATRLLAALGFGADRMYLLPTLRCYGCPEDPHALLSCISNPVREARRACQPLYGRVSPDGAFEVVVDYARSVDFGPVAVERRMEGLALRDDADEGWGFEELDRAQSAGHGETRGRRDALRLLAVFLNNWDTRADNQRLLCLGAGQRDASGARCDRPFAYMQDVGATFGRVGGDSKAERKLDVEGWSQVPIWKDPERCTVAIKSPPFHGATFGEATISESGRRFLADRLAQLSTAQVRALFEGALFASYPGGSPAGRDVGNWVRAFEDKVRQVAKRPPCPTP